MRGPLLRVFLGPGALLREIGGKLELVLRVRQLGLQLDDLLRVDLDVRLQDEHILLCLGERSLELVDLVLIGTPVELEQRLPLLHRYVRLHQHGGDQRRLGQAWNELDRVLDDPRLGRERRDEAQADQEDQHQMHHEERGEEAPADGEVEPSELEEDEPDDESVGEQQNETQEHA